MHASQKAIEREFEALRDIRRRSSSQGGPGSLILDPDLPAEQPAAGPPPLSPQAWAAADDEATNKRSPSGGREGDDGTGTSVVDDPFQLFWVPAHLHPELAPGEFRAFLKEHARAAPADGSGTNLGAALSRASSASSGLGRKRSMLSRQYKPHENDGVEEDEKVVPIRRNKSVYTREGPQLTISDLQKLEELADEASKSEDPTKLRRVLRRSLTLNVAPSFLDQIDDVPDTSDDADAPIIVPPPNQILRRTARTKIRKPNLSGDGGGHRFPTSRRKSGGARTSVDQITSPTEGSSSSHGHETEPAPLVPVPAVPAAPVGTRKRTLELEDQDNRRFTYTEEASIFDAYAESPEDEKSPSPPPSTRPTARLISEATTPRPAPAPAPAPVPTLGPAPSRPSISEPQVSAPEPLAPQPQPAPSTVLHQPQPKRLLSPQQQQQVLQQPSRSPSPETAAQAQEIQRPDSRSSVKSEVATVHSVTSTLTDKRKEKDKKSLWRKVGGSSDKASKKAPKEKDKEKEKEKDSGFFGSLFGGGKKKQEEHPPSNIGGGAGPATAAALLGASKSNNKAYSPSISPQLGNPYARYPIHVERAIYRLSHIKLANPRRPLYEQVLISNLMFWYLGVINKSNQGPGQNQNQGQNQSQQAQNQAQDGGVTQGTPSQGAGVQDGAQATQPVLSEKEQLEREREQMECEERERAEKERADVREQQQRREPKRGSLTKQPPGGRRAEMPVKGPQYHLQSQVIEQEYGNGGGGMPGPSPVARTSSAPPPSMAQNQGYNVNGAYRAQSMQPMKSQQSAQQQMYPQPNGNPNYYYGRSASVDFTGSGASAGSSSSGLPPGAMAPTDPTWLASAQVVGGTLPTRVQQSSSHGYSQSADYSFNQQPSPRTSRSPPGNVSMNNSYDWNRNNGEMPQSGKAPSRSLSANAASVAATQNRQYDQYQQYSQYGQSSQPPNGGLKKKVASASAVAPDRDRRQRTTDDEDVPLAMWQQQRRK